ncbi:MAG: protoporphyrinogen oxidase [Pirellulales bacterium]|nr:protoporphyrinogen oxidase [Pirellulales bacterium]
MSGSTQLESASRPRAAIIGGGIAGLAAAHRLHSLRPDVELRLLERNSRLGGPLDTVRRDGWLVERGADSFTTKLPEAIALCRELGIAEQIVGTNSEHRRALVVRDGRLLPTPEGFVLMRANTIGGVLKSRALSWPGKLRLLAEPLVCVPATVRQPGYDESVARFATRRLGREAFERLVQPLLAGIYVADAERLSLAATMPEFLAAEREHGSLTRAAWRRLVRRTTQSMAPATDELAHGARYGLFVSLQGGLGELIDAIAAALPGGTVQRETSVERLARNEDGSWRLTLASAGRQCEETFDAVILATQAPLAAKLLESTDVELAGLVGRIRCASSAVVGLGFRREHVAHALDGFGFVVPAIERMALVAGSFASVKYPGRVPEECVHLRAFVGGALAPELVDRDDAELVATVRRELDRLLGLRGEPLWSDVARWRDAMPQYDVGHVQLVEAIEARTTALAGLALAGNAYRGVGIPQCIASGRAAAERIAALR